MKKILLVVITLLTRMVDLQAQHCPWDCTGLILLQTNITKEQFAQIAPRLVDEHKTEVVDTIYGTGKETFDRCEFLDCDDFIKYRAGKIALHHWYANDTVYRFAAGMYMVKYNYCKYQGRKLFIEFMHPRTRELKPMFIEVPEENRIHLHNYSRELTNNDSPAIKAATKNAVMIIDCKKWMLRNCE